MRNRPELSWSIAPLVFLLGGCSNLEAAPAFTGITVPLTGCVTSGYLAEATFGDESSPQRMRLIVDTGSATTAVASSDCQQCAGVDPRFVSGASTLATGRMTQSTYQGGASWSGPTLSDFIELSPASGRARTVFAAITEQHDFFRHYDCA